jgi:hypothetical protein
MVESPGHPSNNKLKNINFINVKTFAFANTYP